MANYKIVNGKLVKINDTEKDSNTTSLINTGGDTLTIVKVDPKTGKETIVRPGVSRRGSSTGLPSITPPTQEEINKFYESQPEEKISVDEKLLKQELQKGGTQTITQEFMQLGNITGADIKLALSGLNKNPSQRTKEENQAIQKASQTSDQYRQALIRKQTQTITKTIPGETKKIITQLKEQPKQSNIFDTTYEARKSASQGNISGGFQMTGQIIKNISEKITLPKIPTPLDFLPGFRELGKTNIPEEFAKGTIFGAGETIESAGNIIEAASKRKTYETIVKTGKETADYLIGVGKEAKIEIVPTFGAIPITPKITLSEKHKKDVETGTILAITTGVKIAESFKENPGKELGKLVGGGALLTGASSIGSKFVGFGKAGVQIVKGGKYIKAENLYEFDSKKLLKGRYKIGTPKSTAQEFVTGKNPKQLFHSTGTDFVKGSKGKVLAQETIPSTDVYGLYGSTGTANRAYLRISGSSGYNPVPRIPFLSGSQKIDPTTYRLIGTTKPKRLTSVGKFRNVPEGRVVMTNANISKNIPLTSPANELGIKIENEAILRPGTILSKKGIKGTQDFTFVQGVFVKTPRVRVMPSKPKLSNIKPSKAKIVKNVKPSKSISFEESIRISKNPPTIYNPASLFSSKSSKSSVKSSGSKDYSSFFVSKKGSSVKISNSINSGFSPRPSPSPSPSPSSSPSPTPSPRPSGGSGRRGSGSGSSITITTSTSSTPPSRPSSSIPRLPPRKPPVYKPKLTLPYKPSLFMKKDYTRYKVKNVLTFNRKKVKKKGWLF